MRLTLRSKILLFTVLPLVILAFAMLWLVSRNISRQVDRSVHEDLARASAVFQTLLAARAEELAVASQVIVQDPKFFSLLALPISNPDPQFRATMAGVARDFNSITHADLFEVLNPRGKLLASVGKESSTEAGRRSLVHAALTGQATSGILVEPQSHYQVMLTPVIAGRRLVGILVLGARIGQELAERLRYLTRSDVTFVSGRTVTGSTLESSDDQTTLLDALRQGTFSEGTHVGAVAALRGQQDTYLTLARQIPRSRPGAGQYYVMQRSLETETAFLQEMKLGLLEMGVLAVVLALVAGVLIAEGITAPVRRLVRGAEEMERGNYDYPLDVESQDEIGYLTARFREMRKQQRAYVSSLEEVGRLKSEFINVASHELRTPISIISGFQELLSTERLGPLTEQQQRAMDGIARSVATLIGIAEDATRMAQIEGGRLLLSWGDHDGYGLLDQALKTARLAAPNRKVSISLEAPSDLGQIRADGPRLVQAVTCLVSNAIRFTPDGGYVIVRASRTSDSWEIEVRDTGVGIPGEKIDHIFDRSIMLRDSLNHHSSSMLEFNSAGLGLGLAIARGIVDAHGGTIHVQSEVGRGSSFVIRMPLSSREELEAAA